jgi:hypothetical protein
MQMNNGNYIFSEEQLNRLFPFYILTNSDLIITGMGMSVAKLYQVAKGQRLPDIFQLHPAELGSKPVKELGGLYCQLVKLYAEPGESPMMLAGELEYMCATNELLFLGAPKVAAQNDTRPNQNLGRLNINQEETLAEQGSLVANTVTADGDVLYNSETIKGAAITDKDGKIEWVSRDFEQSTGKKLEEIIGQRPRDSNIW